MKFEIYAGLGGGFGGANYVETIEANTREEAEEYARQCAIDDYESYEGSHGILSRDDVFEDLIESFGEEPLEEDVDLRYMEEVEGWITYYVEEVGV
jgi:hypothetical protein